MQAWQKAIHSFDESLRQRMKQIHKYEITGLPVDDFMNISTQDPEILKEYIFEELEEYLY